MPFNAFTLFPHWGHLMGFDKVVGLKHMSKIPPSINDYKINTILFIRVAGVAYNSDKNITT